MAVELFRHPDVGVGVVAEGPQIAVTEEAVTAGNGEGHNHAIALLQFGHFKTRPTHSPVNSWPTISPDCLVEIAIVDVQVRAINDGGSNLKNGIAGDQNLWTRHVIDTNVLGNVPADRFHGGLGVGVGE